MSSEVIPCPACRHSVRVPESLFGQAVRCPSCKSYFTAPTRDAEGRLGEAELLADAPPPQEQSFEPQPSRRGPSVLIPGLFLLMVGLCGVAVNGTVAAVLSFNIDVVLDVMKKAIDDPKNDFRKADGTKLTHDDVKAENLMPFRNFSVIFLAVSVIVSLGAFAILLKRFYWLALLGSVVAIVNFGVLCCLPGAPVGIFCLVKLCNSDVRSLFRHS